MAFRQAGVRGALVAFHAWIGSVLVRIAETEGTHVPPKPLLSVIALLVPVLAILTLVLGKPDLDAVPLPDWLMQAQARQLPFAVPNP